MQPVSLILDDGRVVSPPPDPELEERISYLAKNLTAGHDAAPSS